MPVYTVVSLEDKAALEEEIFRQVESFRFLVGKDPSHINSHQYVHMREPVRSIALELCQRLGIPLRSLCPQINYLTEFYGQTTEGLPIPARVSVEWLIEALSTLPEGLIVLICHPGYATDLPTMYGLERLEELKVLCSPQLRSAIRELGVKLCSFNDWNYLNRSYIGTGETEMT
jgi:predicted glycoside hydrolase/deacetylase ChbG (UPF0249 family)